MAKKPRRANMDKCPFCVDGGKPMIQRATMNRLFWGACSKCQTQGPPRGTENGAVVAWNTRYVKPKKTYKPRTPKDVVPTETGEETTSGRDINEQKRTTSDDTGLAAPDLPS